MDSFYLNISYLVAVLTFIIGLKRLSSPEKARNGNLIAAVGMLLAVIATILFHEDRAGASIGNIPWILAAIAVGTLFGYLLAMRVKMTSMPQMVSFFNGMGGACAAIISLVEFRMHPSHDFGFLVIVILGLVIGSVSFSGSMIAWGKLEGKIGDPKSKWLGIANNIFLLVFAVAFVLSLVNPAIFGSYLIWIMLGMALVYGVLFVMPIGGADMPVVISLLNSFTGLAAAIGGFMYHNPVMLMGGILVGSAGTILTILMCKAMNRSLRNVVIGSFGGVDTDAAAKTGEDVVREISLTDAAILCGYAQKVGIVPGYGLAVAQAQHTCHDFEKLLEKNGVEVYYAIHPVAGRMPGHMNVLLAEADVPYPKLLEMEDANDQMESTDVAIVVGANDVVNPAAENDPASPIYGMPILNVNKAKHVIIMKRSMNMGYAGIANELFFEENSRMLFGDAKDSLQHLVAELKDL